MGPENAEAVRLINSAMEFYRASHEVPPEAEIEVLRDFAVFNLRAIEMGLRGIRWNFSGCIACPERVVPVRLRRILLADPFTVKAAGGRAFGTEICKDHESAMDTAEGLATVIIPGALRRIAQEPPRLKAAA